MSQPSWIGHALNNRYKIEDELGAGGMSAVYKASDPNLKRVVAIKLIHPHLSKDPEFVRRFEAEAAAVAQLRHPNIIQVFDFNHDGDTYYMVLEFVPGETLQARLKRLVGANRKLSIEEVVKFAAQICEAADYAHKRGLVHRDIKPANVMLDIHGNAILMDFGIVRIVGGTNHTATGAVVGTALYMSPEQIRGEHPDHRADIYSLGIMLFEMAGGRPPYNADSAMTIMMMHLNDPIPDIGTLNPSVPRGLRAIVEKALAKDPKDRYQSAAQMAADLRNLLAAPTPSIATMMEPTPPQATYVEPPATRPPAPSPARTPPSTGGGTTPPPGSSPAAPAKKKGLSPAVWIAGGIGLILLLCLVGGALALPRIRTLIAGRNGGPVVTEPVGIAIAGETPTLAIIEATETPAPTSTPTATPPPTETATPTEPPTITPTATPEGPYVVITSIKIENGVYVIDYQTHNYPEDQPSMHVHMFFNTVPPEQAGSPGVGPWKLTWGPYGAPPFIQYGPANRPPDATQMCALVANANHSILLNSGNCIDLPAQ